MDGARTLRHAREALFVAQNTLRVNCGRCGKKLLVTPEDLRKKRVIDCDGCVENEPQVLLESRRLPGALSRVSLVLS